MTDLAEKVWLVDELADVLRVGKSTLYQAIAAGEIRAVRIRGAIRIPDSVVRELLTGEAS